MANPKAQSAMQYLITYGWMIIVVAAVIFALFYLGVLIPPTGARAPPGACHVLRPNGPGSNQFMSLAGVCIGELPEYVLQLPSAAGTNVVEITNPSFLSSLGGSSYSLSISYWVYFLEPSPEGVNPYTPIVTRKLQFGSCIDANPDDNLIELKDGSTDNGPIDRYPISLDSWYFVTDTLNINNDVNTIIIYVNDTPAYQINYPNGPILYTGESSDTWPLFIGGQTSSYFAACGGAASVLNGYLSNVQIYNISLSANQVEELYHEGIGGAPIELPNLVGWWPLDGTLNDYSGNDNNGTMSGNAIPTFNNNWLEDTGYSPS